MKRLRLPLLILLILPGITVNGQKLKKADRATLANLQAHQAYFSSGKHKTETAGDRQAAEYLGRQFEQAGLKPGGEGVSWLQPFEIHDGRAVQPSSHLYINDKPLALGKDYFPFPFSASKGTRAAVAMALAEEGVPWFKDLQEILEEQGGTGSGTAALSSLISQKAKHAASKGATALLVYNGSGRSKDLVFDKTDTTPTAPIPVLYVTSEGYGKYFPAESGILDIRLEVAVNEAKRPAHNVLGRWHNGSANWVIVSAVLEDEKSTAVLIELAKKLKTLRRAPYSYFFVAYAGDSGQQGRDYFFAHPPPDAQNIKSQLAISVPGDTETPESQLALVHQYLDKIRTGTAF